MKDLPQSVTVNTALDAVSHAVEGMLSVRAGALSDALARESLRLLLGEYPSLSKGEYSALSRQNLLNGAALAGMVIANTGTSPVHGMGYSLTYFHGVAHGRANGLLLPAFLAVCERKIPARMSEICAALGMSVREFTDRVAALLGGRESLTDAERRDYAARAAKNKNVANCLAKFSEADLYEVLDEYKDGGLSARTVVLGTARRRDGDARVRSASVHRRGGRARSGRNADLAVDPFPPYAPYGRRQGLEGEAFRYAGRRTA